MLEIMQFSMLCISCYEVQKRKSALFLLHLKEGKCLSQVAINEVVFASQKLFKHTLGRCQAGVNYQRRD